MKTISSRIVFCFCYFYSMSIKIEIWKPVVGYEGLYEVSSFGRVRSSNYQNKNKILKYDFVRSGYLRVTLCKNGKTKHYLVHRLVAIAFLSNPENLPQVNHRDEDKQNNHVDNLEWCSAKYNTNYGTRTQKTSKSVLQFTKTGELIAEYPSTHEIERLYGYDCSSIAACCRGYRLKSAYGYIWKFKD